jgi:hypothetical protein
VNDVFTAERVYIMSTEKRDILSMSQSEIFALSRRLNEVMDRVEKKAMPIADALEAIQAVLDGNYRIVRSSIDQYGRYLLHIEDQIERWFVLNRQVPEILRIDEYLLDDLCKKSDHYQSVDDLESFIVGFLNPQTIIDYVLTILRIVLPDCVISDRCFDKRLSVKFERRPFDRFEDANLSQVYEGSHGDGMRVSITKSRMDLLSYRGINQDSISDIVCNSEYYLMGMMALFALCLQDSRIFWYFNGENLPKIVITDVYYSNGKSQEYLCAYYDKSKNCFRVDFMPDEYITVYHSIPTIKNKTK